jgi:uncharacterized protein
MVEPTLLLTLAAGSAGALIAQRLALPGGLILGAMAGAAVVAIVRGGGAVEVPQPLRAAAFIVIGATIGAEITRPALAALRTVLVPAVLAGALIIVAGVAIAWLLRGVGLAPPGDLLATSPGALSVMSAMAVERGTGTVEVAVFHLVRVVMVILSLPLLVAFLRAGP